MITRPLNLWLLATFCLSLFIGSTVAAAQENPPEAAQALGVEGFLEPAEGEAQNPDQPFPKIHLLQRIPANSVYQSNVELLMEREGFSAEDAGRIHSEILMLFDEMRQKGREEEKSLSGEDFEARLEQGLIAHKNADLGRAKVTKNNGVKWIKVVHKKSRIAFIFFNDDKIKLGDEHSDLILANIHFNGGKHDAPELFSDPKQRKQRENGALFGRDVSVQMYHERDGLPDAPPTIVSTSFFERPKKETEQHKYEFKLACDKPLSWGNIFINGTLVGAAQVAVLVGLNQLSPHIPYIGGKMEPLHWGVLAFTFAYSHYAGGWLYPKLRARSQSMTYSSRFWLRGLTISLPYAVTYKAFTTYGQFSEALAVGMAPLVGYFLTQFVNIGINFFINNRVSNALNEHTQLDQELRAFPGNVKWAEKMGIYARRTDTIGQIRYIKVSFTTRTAELNNNFNGIHIPLPAIGDYFLSSGKLIYLIIPSIINYTVVRRAEKGGHRTEASAVQYRAKWEKSLSGRALRGIRNLPSLCRSGLQRIGQMMNEPSLTRSNLNSGNSSDHFSSFH